MELKRFKKGPPILKKSEKILLLLLREAGREKGRGGTGEVTPEVQAGESGRLLSCQIKKHRSLSKEIGFIIPYLRGGKKIGQRDV